MHVFQLPRLLWQRRSTAALGTIIIAMIWGVIIWKGINDRESDLDDAKRVNRNFAMLFEENVLRSLGEIDKAILYLRENVEARQQVARYEDIVNSTAVLSEIIVQVSIVDASGIIRATNGQLARKEPGTQISVADREHIKVQLNSTSDRLFISKPVIGRASGQSSVNMTRRFMDREGKIAGVVVASLNPAHFTQFYNTLDLGREAMIAMIGADGVVRSSGGSGGGYPLGLDLSDTSIFAHLKQGETNFEVFETSGKEPMLVAARNVRGYPLWVTVGVNKNEVLKSSLIGLKHNAIIGTLCTLVVLLIIEQMLRAEAARKQKAEQLRVTLEHMNQGIMLVTNEHQIPIINRRCGELLKLPEEWLRHPPSFDVLAKSHIENNPVRQETVDELKKHAEVGESTGTTLIERVRPDGTIIEIRTTHLPDGGVVQTFSDITVRCEAEARIAKLAAEDPLTRLPNRRVFSATVEKLCNDVEVQRPSNRQREFAILFLDLDYFKVINDTLGHQIGDQLLIKVAERLRSVLRNADVLARLGGDEFAIVIPRAHSYERLAALAGRLLNAVQEPYDISGHQVQASASIGIAVGPRDGRTGEELLVAADLALYAVKSSGRGNFRFFERSMNESVSERRKVEIELREALARNELQLHYQPIVNLKSGEIVAVEALARWNHPNRGFIPPAEFIPIAEDSGLIVRIGEWALRTACRQATMLPENLQVSVNLSPAQLFASDFVGVLQLILAETGLDAKRLTLEITERVLMRDTPQTLDLLGQLKSVGVRIAMDDFGTGYSSLSYLRSFPFDDIKIDRSFVLDLGERTDAYVIVQAILLIASGLGIRTVAEGVESESQRRALQAFGCDEAQGYLFSRAIPFEKVHDFVKDWERRRDIAA